MSSVPTRIQTLSNECFLREKHQLGFGEKRPPLTRSTSLGKIKQFNTFICSQSFYILPSIIAWWKSSQTVLQSQIEWSSKSLNLTLVVVLVFNLVLRLLKICVDSFKTICDKFCESDFASAIELLSLVVHSYVSLTIESIKRKLLILVTYAAVLLIFLQLGTCIIVITTVYLPTGLIFMFVCLYCITHIYVRLLFHYLNKHESKLSTSRSNMRTRRLVLAKRL